MYNHLDQGWRLQPALMAEETLRQVAWRICEYVTALNINRFAVLYHGGEPLLLGADKLATHTQLFRQLLPKGVEAEFSLQTNGVLLSEDELNKLEKSQIKVSLSLDGPSSVNDLHRLDHKGHSTFERTVHALELLTQRPALFTGVIAVIDPTTNPAEVLEFFYQKGVKQLDFLFPDANYLAPPLGRQAAPELYKEWIIKCFDAWFDIYPQISIRTFEAILNGLMGLPSNTDALGFGDVSLITIESDGTYHDLDVLKITGTGTSLGKGGVATTDIQDVLTTERIQAHRALLRKEGLSETCQACKVVDICGGGAVAHRYNQDGYRHPSIYCNELYGLIKHAEIRVLAQLEYEGGIKGPADSRVDQAFIIQFEQQAGMSEALTYLVESFQKDQAEKLRSVLTTITSLEAQPTAERLLALPEADFNWLASQPSVVAWAEVMWKNILGVSVHAIDGSLLPVEPTYLETFPALLTGKEKSPSQHRPDKWLRSLFGSSVHFEEPADIVGYSQLVDEALLLIHEWDPAFSQEMEAISPEIQFIRDPTAHPDKIVSFSDNSVPGALYVQIRKETGFIDAYDLADSLIHEHRHQRLYLFQHTCPIVSSDAELVQSPWREELRPPSGLFHAVYVFVKLLHFWSYVAASTTDNQIRVRAQAENLAILGRLRAGFVVLKQCPLTDAGHLLMQELYQQAFAERV